MITINHIYEKDYRITQVFGVNKSSYTRFGLLGHNGIDFGTPTGTKLFSGFKGQIINLGYDEGGFGNFVTVATRVKPFVYKGKTVRSFYTIHAHLSKFGNFKPYDHVDTFDVIGYSGNTGNSTGPHLHWGLYLIGNANQVLFTDNGFKGAMNPFDSNLINWKLTDIDESKADDKELLKQNADLVRRLKEYQKFDELINLIKKFK